MEKKIEDYGIVGNLHTVALISDDGGVDWLCLPYIDSPSVFGALLDISKGGRFAVNPASPWDSTAAYLPQSNILVTTFRTADGIVRLTDFMPATAKTEIGPAPFTMYRLIEAVEGAGEIEVLFKPRFDYGRAETVLEYFENGVTASAGDERIYLSCSQQGMTIENDSVRAVFSLRQGDRIGLRLTGKEEASGKFDFDRAHESLANTRKFWKDWIERSETGVDLELGPFKDMIDRCALVLKLLEFQPTGAIAAAATTSLPEEIGGVRNWDYRFSWIRDSALTVEALYNTGHLKEMEQYLRWLEKVISESDGDPLIMYGLRGESELVEEELAHLKGYKNSRPVRIGNEAYSQKQLDIYGEIMDAALRLSNYVGKIDFDLWPFMRKMCEIVAENWQHKDAGIWEVRGGPYHFVYSKVMCWVALDRGVKIARRYGFPADVERWEKTREQIGKEVLEKGWNKKKKAFVQHYDTDALDAANLLIPFYGFLSYDDPRMVSTVEAIQKELCRDNLVYRYLSEDGLPGTEGAFIVCTFWLIDNLIGQKNLEHAQILLLRMENIANRLGLFSEEYDPRWGEALGNFPQAFTHIGYINSVVSLCKAREKTKTAPREKNSAYKWMVQKLCFGKKYVLNDGPASKEVSSRAIGEDLKHRMNVLRGAFFRTAEGRVAYEEMTHSSAYKDYVNCTYHLKHFDLDRFETREEKIAFWINLFNVLTIHGVVELGIRKSVKEVFRFFRRIQYRVGNHVFSADEIEHGILRGNNRLPNSLFRPFGA